LGQDVSEIYHSMIHHIFFQSYSQADFCFSISDILQKNTGTNGNKALPWVAFSAVLGIVRSLTPSGVSSVQDLVGD